MTFVKTALFHKAGEGSGGGGGGSDPHNLGFYADLTALQTAHPTGSDGDFAILGSTDTVWVWDSGTSAWKDTDTKGQVTSVNGQTGAVTVDTLPSQTGNAGKFLTTDGTDASWSDKPLVNTATGTGSLAIGSGSASGSGTVSVGSATSSGNGSIFIGSLSQGTNAQDEIAIGWYAAGGARNGITIGGYTSSGTVPLGTICIGRYANPTPIRNENETGTFWVTLWKSTSSSGTYKLMSSDGTIPADRLVHAINKYSTMPTAASTNEGWIVQFTGTTDSTYTHGHLYECVSDGQTPATYSWTEVSLGGGGGSYLPLTGGTLTGDVSLNGQTAILFDGGSKGYMRSAGIVYQTELGYKDGSSYRKIFTLDFGSGAIVPSVNASYHTLGKSSLRWGNVYTTKINNGADITVPSVAGEMAVKQVNTTITLAAADWSSNTQTVTVNGVTSTSVVFVAPDPADTTDYVSAGILCTSQTTNSLTFTATTTPSADIDVVVVAM